MKRFCQIDLLFSSSIRKAELALAKVQLQELTAKGMVFDRFAVAYGKFSIEFDEEKRIISIHWFV